MRASHNAPSRHRVVVVGGGFGGLEAVKALRGVPVDITLVDRNNYHLFQPLTYQVATAGLSPDEVSEPLRRIFRRSPRVTVLMATVTGFDLQRQVVFIRPVVGELEAQTIPYDTLIVAAGSSYSYFGHDEWRPLALDVKSLDSALRVRGQILRAFEAAQMEPEARSRAAWLTFVIVGAGPTGVEMAGQIAELARDIIPRDFRAVDPRLAQVLLVEMADRVLTTFPPSLSRRAAGSLEELGVRPLTGHAVVGIESDGVEIRGPDGATNRVPCHTVIWAAGVEASPLAGALAEESGSELDAGGRLTVESDLSLRGHPEVLAVGDMAVVRDAHTGRVQTFPGLAPVAMQQGRYAGRLVRDRLAGSPTRPFRYRDKGDLATIGRARAVADLRVARLSGFAAWLIWLAVHLVYLIGFENRAVVLLRWAYYFFTRNRGSRVISEPPEPADSRRSRNWPDSDSLATPAVSGRSRMG